MNNQYSMGIKDLLNTGAPNGEHLAYINDDEASILKYMGGSGRTDNNPYGIPSYDDVDESGGGDDGDDYSGEGDTSYSGGDGGASTSTFGITPSLEGYYGVNTPGYDELIPSYINTDSRPPGYFGNMVSSPDAFGGNPVGGGTGLNAGLGYGRDGSDYNSFYYTQPPDRPYEYMSDDNYNQAVEGTEDFTSWLGSLFGITSPLEYDGKKFSEGTGFSIMDNPALDLGLGAVTGGLFPTIKNAAKNVYRGNYLNALIDAVAPTSLIQANDLAGRVNLSASDLRKGDVLQNPGMITENIGDALNKATSFPDRVEQAYNNMIGFPSADVDTDETPLGDGIGLFGTNLNYTPSDDPNSFGSSDEEGNYENVEQTSPLRMLQPTSPAVAPVQQQVLAELARPTRTGTGLNFDWTKPATGRRYFNTPTLTDYV